MPRSKQTRNDAKLPDTTLIFDGFSGNTADFVTEGGDFTSLSVRGLPGGVLHQ
jgi:hypothetical protein